MESQTGTVAASRWQVALIAIGLAVVTIAIFGRMAVHDFIHYDDPHYVYENRVVKAGFTPIGVRWAMTSFVLGNWHPVTMLSHMLDCHLFGVHAGAHHLVSLGFHVANTILLFALFLQMTGQLWPSALVAALFAWHPLHVESVCWISERKDVLSTFFGLWSLIAYVRYVHRRSLFAYLSSTGLLILSLLSKPMLVTLPFLLLLLDYWPLGRIDDLDPRAASTRRQGMRLLNEKTLFFVIIGVFAFTTLVSQRRIGAVAGMQEMALPVRLANVSMAYNHYVVGLLWPVGLAVPYPFTHIMPDYTFGTIAAIGIVLVTVLVLRWRRDYRYLPMGWFWFLGTLVPVIGFVQVGEQRMADRYSYIPLIGLFVIIAWGLADIARAEARWRKPVIAGVSVWLAVLAVLCWLQVGRWKNSMTLFRHAIAVTRDNYIAHNLLSSALLDEGRREEALVELDKSLAIYDAAKVHYNRGMLLRELGRVDEGIESLTRATEAGDPQISILANISLGHVFITQHDYAAAVGRFQIAMEKFPDSAVVRFGLIQGLVALGRIDEAMELCRQRLRVEPRDTVAADRLAWILSTTPDRRLRDGAEAVFLARKACRLDGANPIHQDTLAMAYAEAGQFDEATKSVDKALKTVESSASKWGMERTQTHATIMRHRRQLYEVGRPFRQQGIPWPMSVFVDPLETKGL